MVHSQGLQLTWPLLALPPTVNESIESNSIFEQCVPAIGTSTSFVLPGDMQMVWEMGAWEHLPGHEEATWHKILKGCTHPMPTENGHGPVCPAEKGLRVQRGLWVCWGHPEGELWMEERPFLLGQANESGWQAAPQPTAGVLTDALSCPEMPHMASPNCLTMIIPSIYTKHLSSQESAVFSQHWFSKPARQNWIKIHSNHSHQASPLAPACSLLQTLPWLSQQK